jgi:hypothetical protein
MFRLQERFMSLVLLSGATLEPVATFPHLNMTIERSHDGHLG